MNRDGTILTTAIEKMRKDLMDNQELFISQIIHKNPDIDFMDYTLCYMNCYEGSEAYTKYWLEKR